MTAINRIETVGDLTALLEEFDPDTPVRLAHQPAWPFEYTLGGTAHTDHNDPHHGTFWLAAGDQVGYLPGDAARQLGWNH